MKRGHSNVVRLDEIESCPSGRVLIPIVGGAHVYTVKDLPPLALSKKEWEEIGVKAGWMEVN